MDYNIDYKKKIIFVICALIVSTIIICYDIYIYNKKYVLADNQVIIGSKIEYDCQGKHYVKFKLGSSTYNKKIFCSQNNPDNYTLSLFNPNIYNIFQTIIFLVGLILASLHMLFNITMSDHTIEKISYISNIKNDMNNIIR